MGPTVDTPGPPRDPPEDGYVVPAVLYPSNASQQTISVPLDAFARTESAAGWFVPGLVTGVPGLLLILLVLGNVLLGVSWVPNVSRLLGPEPDEPDDDEHLWWASGRPLS